MDDVPIYAYEVYRVALFAHSHLLTVPHDALFSARVERTERIQLTWAIFCMRSSAAVWASFQGKSTRPSSGATPSHSHQALNVMMVNPDFSLRRSSECAHPQARQTMRRANVRLSTAEVLMLLACITYSLPELPADPRQPAHIWPVRRSQSGSAQRPT